MNLNYQAQLAHQREVLVSRMREALARSGRCEQDARIIAVSKTVEPSVVDLAYEAGYRIFAENRPQELLRKTAEITSTDVRFDLIGTLQTNKINMVLGKATLIHSVDSCKLARAIDQRAAREGLIQPILLEVNTSGEDSKMGMSREQVIHDFEDILSLEHLEIHGMMTMAAQGDIAAAQKSFESLRLLRDYLHDRYATNARIQSTSFVGSESFLRELSMGMSEDFEVALMEGATLLRLGRIVFDPHLFD